MARGSKGRKRPLKGLLAWVGLAILALVAAKKTVGRLMGHKAEKADSGAPPDDDEVTVEAVDQAETEGPEPALDG